MGKYNTYVNPPKGFKKYICFFNQSGSLPNICINFTQTIS